MRTVALAETIYEDMKVWLHEHGWVAPIHGVSIGKIESTNFKDNFIGRYLRPALARVKLEWVSYPMMRRTHASLMRDLKVDPEVVADNMRHGIAVNQNVYTQTSLNAWQEVTETLASALVHSCGRSVVYRLAFRWIVLKFRVI